ncbi:MAG: hypothetical protein HY725_19420, partial [Candidatus Rokubacteria bacterium]|nr:hypothetical protein [Candidatus Rokubacteria bacterium]
MAEILCPGCRHFVPALDPNIARAFLGACKKKEAPFLLILPKEGVTECDVYLKATKTVQVAEGARLERGPTAKATPAEKRVVFFYSSGTAPGEQFPCNPRKALSLIDQLNARGVQCEARDLAKQKDVFPDYHKAVTGPSAQKRPVFGMKGALEEDFGRRVPALMIFEGDRYPAEVFPRMDRELNRVLGVEEALERLL